jgi:superkiller protein 3
LAFPFAFPSALPVAFALLSVAVGGCGGHTQQGGKPAPIVAAVLPKVGAEAQAEFDEGIRLMRSGRKHYKEARKHLTRATQLDDKLFEGWHNLGVLEAAIGNHDAAIEAFRKASDIQPASRKTVLAYGEALRRARRPKKAAKLYQQRLESEPNDAEIRARYGQVLREAGDLEASLEQARILLGQGGENIGKTVIAYNSLGLTYYKMGKLDLAETALRKAADLDAKSAFVWNNLGLVAFERGHDQEAFLHFQKASELDPKYVQARLNKAVVYLDCGDYKHARAELERAVEIDPTDAEAHVALGVAARGEGKIELAKKSYDRALDIEPEYPPALYNLGVLYMDFEKDKARAKDFLAQFLAVVDDSEPKRQDAQNRLKEMK